MDEKNNENSVESQPRVKITDKKDFKPIIIYFVTQVVVSFILSFFWVFRGFTDSDAILKDPTFLSIYLILYGLAGAIILILLYREKITNDFKNITKNKLGYTLLASVGIILMNYIVYGIFIKLNVPTSNQDTLTSLSNMFQIPYFITLVLFFPLMEEFLCRYSLRTFFSNKILFVLISSIVFALLHGVGIATILYFLLGVGFSLIYVKSDDNIVCSFIAHSLNNLIAVISLFV